MSRPPHTHLAARRAHRLRREMTISEAALWSGISRRQTGDWFRRQVPIGEWIADFACLDPKLVIEVDDDSHDWRDETVRTAYIEAQGFRILRFDNADLAESSDVDTVETVRWWVEALRAGRDPEE